MKYKIGDYIKRTSNESSRKWLIAFWIGETVEIIDYLKCSEPVYVCKNQHGIIWRLRETEVEKSTVSDYIAPFKKNTPEFIQDSLYLCGVEKRTSNPHEKPQSFKSTRLNWLFALDHHFDLYSLKRLFRIRVI